MFSKTKNEPVPGKFIRRTLLNSTPRRQSSTKLNRRDMLRRSGGGFGAVALAALLAEAQLLAMETTLDPEHRAAVDRMTELVRRLITLVRGLDSKVNDKMFPR